MNQLWQIFLGTLTNTSNGSEKRVNKMVVVVTCLGLTIYDTIHGQNLRTEVLIAWLGFAGYDGYRITKEKKDMQDTAVKTNQTSADIAREVIKSG